MKAIKQSQGLCCQYNKYQINSSKKWIVILHAWDVDGSESWENTAMSLNLKGFNVVLIDLPGFGKSQSPLSVWSTGEYAAFVRQFLYELDIQPLIIIGHSFGGAIATRMATQPHTGIKGLVLIAPCLEYPSTQLTLKEKLIRQAQSVYRSLIEYPIFKTALSPLRTAFKYFLGVSEYQQNSSIMKSINHKIRTEESLGFLKSITIPTLLVWGSGDQYMPITNAISIISQLQTGQLKIYDRANHRLQLTHLPYLVEDINAFFEDNKYTFALS
jgi:pimeloyl-ACP methyl ester carboxylesterase